jgi:predicted nucleotidyltransferase
MQITPEHRVWIEQSINQVVGDALRAVYVVGSRARGTAHRGSDADLLIDADPPLSITQRGTLCEIFEESDLPYAVDIIDGATLDTTVRQRMMQGAVRLL